MKNIALALSGGGFRAAAFSLGSLSYLNTVSFDGKPLLENVKFIGSSSGGSITNIMYSAAICKKDTFTGVYQRLFKALEGEELIKEAFRILYDADAWKLRPKKSRNLINAFAMAYDSILYYEESFGVFSRGIAGTHLEEISVNSTEFTNGISFRFQSQHTDSRFPRGRVGNNYIYFSRNAVAVADHLRLSDILACSSCFPGGFEPFIFPDDFTHSGLAVKKLSDSIIFKSNPFTPPGNPNDIVVDKEFDDIKNRFGIMDGGIADNQAIDSVLLANDRRKRAELPLFDLIIVTDVTSYFMDGYTLPTEKKGKTSANSILTVVNALIFFGILFPLLIVISLFSGWKAWMYILLVPAFISLLAYGFVKLKVSEIMTEFDKRQSTWGITLFKYGGYFLNLRFYLLKQMLLSRIKSVFILADDIYLKQIRRHYYKQLYRDPELSKIVISNAIYDLSTVKQKAEEDTEVVKVIGFNTLDGKGESSIINPGHLLISVAEKARLMPSTLWFDKYQVKDNIRAAIIATGQFTTCFNLLKYIEKLENRLLEEEEEKSPEERVPGHVPVLDAEILTLKSALKADWERFIKDPYFLYNQEGEDIPGFISMT